MAYSQQVRVKKIGLIDGMGRTASKQYVARLLSVARRMRPG